MMNTTMFCSSRSRSLPYAACGSQQSSLAAANDCGLYSYLSNTLGKESGNGMEAASASPNLHPPCLQEIRSVKDKPFYCQSSVGTIPQCQGQAFLLPVFPQCQGQAFLLPFQGRVFLLLPFCKRNASLQQLLSHMATAWLSTNCPRANSMMRCDVM